MGLSPRPDGDSGKVATVEPGLLQAGDAASRDTELIFVVEVVFYPFVAFRSVAAPEGHRSGLGSAENGLADRGSGGCTRTTTSESNNSR